MSQPIPDPEHPTTTAIDGETGDLMAGVFLIPTPADPNAPTVAELEAGTHLGWTRNPLDPEETR